MSVLDVATLHRRHCFSCAEAQSDHIYIQQMSPLIRAAVCETKTQHCYVCSSQYNVADTGLICEIKQKIFQNWFFTDAGHVF